MSQAWSATTHMSMNVTAGPSRAGTWFCPTHLSHLQLWAEGSGRYIITQVDFGGSQFPDDKNKVGPQSVGLLTIQPPELVASLRIFYWK